MIRESQIEKLLRAQGDYDSTVRTRPADDAGRNRAAAVVGSAFRAASKDEQIEFEQRRRNG